jgi:hypothetical protein
MKKWLRLVVCLVALLGGLAVAATPANATTGRTICNRHGEIKVSCLRLDAAGTYVETAHNYVLNGGLVKGHWQLRYPVGGRDVYLNSQDIVWHPDTSHRTARWDPAINRYQDSNTYFCARFWRNYQQGSWDLPFGDWNCVLVTP